MDAICLLLRVVEAKLFLDEGWLQLCAVVGWWVGSNYLCVCEEHDFRVRFFLASSLAAAKSVGGGRSVALAKGGVVDRTAILSERRHARSLDLISRKKFRQN